MKNGLIFSTIQGHASISEAISESLQRHQIETTIITDEYPGASGVRLMYRHLPQVGQLIFNTCNLSFLQPLIHQFLHQKYDQFVYKHLRENQPKFVINVSFGYTPSLAKYKKELHYKFINVIVNPLTFFRPELSVGADYNCIFDEQQATLCLKTQPQAKTIQTGWFVREKYEQAYQKNEIRKKLKISEDSLVFLFVSGSEGQKKAISLLPQLSHTLKPVICFIACGTNEALFQEVLQQQKKFLKTSKLQLIPLRFTQNLYQYMQAADLVLGKAGPNTIFEAVATRTPFFALSHIFGQENGNLEIIKKFQLGYVEEDSQKAVQIIEKIIEHPELLDQFMIPIEKMASYNMKSKEKLLQLISLN